MKAVNFISSVPEFMWLYVAVIIGACIWLLIRLNIAFKKPGFTFKNYLRINLPAMILNVSCGLALVWLRDDIVSIVVVTKFVAISFGMSGQAVFGEMMKVFDKEKPTLIGLNK